MSSDTPAAAALRAHGGLLAAELAALGIDPDGIVDFSVNVNPYGPAPAVVEAGRRAAFDRYPDPTAWPLRQAIARRIEVSPDRIVVGNGAADLFWTLARVLLREGDPVQIVGPTFAELPAAARAVGCAVTEWCARPEDGFAVDLAEVARLAQTARPRLLYLCAPNNPTGIHVCADAVAELAAALPGVTILLDQAFLGLSPFYRELAAPLPPSVVCVRSMTKDHAIPGLRLGYLVASAALASALESGHPPWMVSGPAQAAGLAALDEDAFTASCRVRLLRDRDALADTLRALGLAPVPSATTFFLLPVRDPSTLRTRLLRRGVLVRDCTSFGLPGYIRLAARPAPDRARLVAALRAELPC